MLEREFQVWVVKQAKKAGWHVTHVQRMMVKGRWMTGTSERGFPDLVLVRPPQIVFLELKRSRKEKPRSEQIAYIAKLQRCEGVEAYIVGPEDANDVLDLLARPRPATNIQSVPPEQEGSTS